ncbi:asparaginase [uncultured Corynebacterium sp.]|uniref:asparaginase n=1 Tax=uncultured Corynebacterium sp. TaxID=159447 RepID=UPI0025D0A4A1|nr:asparaginase [uncultured Corynebacterium sp.]
MTSTPSRNSMQIPVLGTGGTISCTHSPEGDLVPTLTCTDIVKQARIPQGLEPLPHDIMSIDSSSITLPQIDELVAHIANFCSPTPAGIVVLHGTDTMEESALAAACALDLPCPVVFTGAQRPGDDAAPDGPANLSRAFAALASGELSAGVHLVFGDAILPARGAYKAHTTAETAFRNALIDSGKHDDGSPSPDGTVLPPLQVAGLYVPIVGTFAGDDGQLIRALREQDKREQDTKVQSKAAAVDGLVLAAMGSGNIPTAVAEELEAWRAERPTELPVIVCSRVPTGGVSFVYGGTGGGAQLARAGFRSGGALRPSQARIELLYELARAR